MKKDRHRPGYYTEYNKKYPERLNRGYTKGYKNDNVCEGKIEYKKPKRTQYDRTFNLTLSELLYDKVFVEYHDDDWAED